MQDLGLVAVIGVVLALVAGGFFILLAIPSFFLLWGARIAGIENRSFGRAMVAVLVSWIVSAVAIVILGMFTPEGGQYFGLAANFLISAFITAPLFGTTFGRALLAAVLAWILSFLVLGGIVMALVFAGYLKSYIPA